MKTVCPNMKNPDVARDFNEMKNATSEKTAYNVWSKNDGNGIDRAPNGAPSILFQNLKATLKNKVTAIRAKSDLFGKSFLSKFNWLNEKTGAIFKDHNGEIYSGILTRDDSQEDPIEDAKEDISMANMADYLKGRAQSSATDVLHIMRNFANDQQKAVIDLMLRSLNEHGDIMIYTVPIKAFVYRTDENGEPVRTLSKSLIVSPKTYNFEGVTVSDEDNLSNGKMELAIILDSNMKKSNFESNIMHELVHAFTNSYIDSHPELLDKINELISLAKKQFNVTDTSSGLWYGLNDYGEFLSEYIGNKEFREKLNTKIDTSSILDSIVSSVYGETYSQNAEKLFNDIMELDMKIKYLNYDFLQMSKHQSENSPYSDNQLSIEGANFYYRINPDTFQFERTHVDLELNNSNANGTLLYHTLEIADLNNGVSVESSRLFKLFDDKIGTGEMNLSDGDTSFYNLLRASNIPVLLRDMNDSEGIAKIYTDTETGQSIIVLNKSIINQSKVSDEAILRAILHETAHAITVTAYDTDTEFKRSVDEVYAKILLMFPKNEFYYADSERYYFTSSPKELISEFVSNEEARNLIYKALYDNYSKSLAGRFKRFINSIVRLFSSKYQLSTPNFRELYEELFKSYLIGIPLLINHNDVLSLDYKISTLNIDQLNKEQLIQHSVQLNRSIHNFNLRPTNIGNSDTREDAEKKLDQLATDISSLLSQRLKAIIASNMDPKIKTLLQKELNLQISQFNQGLSLMFRSIISLLDTLAPLLLEDSKMINKISKANDKMDPTLLLYQLHDNFGVYEIILRNISTTLKNSKSVIDILREQSKGSSVAKDVVYGDIDDIYKSLTNCQLICSDAKASLANVVVLTAKDTLHQVGEETHSITMDEYLDNLKSIGFDSSVFFKYGGMGDRVKDEGVRSIVHIVNNAIWSADREQRKNDTEIAKAIDGLKLAENVYDIYERDKNGNTTLYVVRDLNFGLLHNDYNEHLRQLNKHISSKYGILLEPDNFVAPDENVEAMREWNDLNNEWLGEHAHRMFKKEYYTAYSKLSSDTRMEWTNIQALIKAVKELCKGTDGYYHFEDLDETNRKLLSELTILKRLMLSPYDFDGQPKVGEELRKYKELTLLQDDLHRIGNPNNQRREIERDTEAWIAARNNIIEQCGGKEEYRKYMNGEENKFNGKKLKKWDLLNSKQVLKLYKPGDAEYDSTDPNNNTILFRTIDEESGGKTVYEVDGDGGEAYNKVNEAINNILRVYKNYATGEVEWENVPLHERIRLNKLSKLLNLIRKKAKKSKSFKQKLELRAKLFDKYASSQFTLSYLKIRKEAAAAEALSTGMYEMMMGQTMEINWIDPNTGAESYRTKRWFTKLTAKEGYEDQFFDFVPGDGWIKQSDNNDLVDQEYIKYKNAHPESNDRIIPKRELYDNSKLFNKIQNSKSLKALYDVTIKTIKETNELYGIEYSNPYMLPGITGTYMMRIHNKRTLPSLIYHYTLDKIRNNHISRDQSFKKYFVQNSKFMETLRYIGDKVGIGKLSVQQNPNLKQDSSDILSSHDDFGHLLLMKGVNINSGQRPDGSSLNMVPRYYTNKLEHPELVSLDLGAILSDSHRNALNYANKMKVKDQCETIVDMIKNRNVYKTDIHDFGSTIKKIFNSKDVKFRKIPGELSNTYEIAKKFLEMNLYNIRSKHNEYKIPLLNGKSITFTPKAIGDLIGKFTVWLNLGCNVVVAATGFLTASFAHMVQSVTGQHYSSGNNAKAGAIVLCHLFKNFMGAKYIANRSTNDKLMLLTELFNTANQGDNKLQHTNWKANKIAITRSLANIVSRVSFGMLSGFDFLIKSLITVSTMLGFHYYDGEFCTMEDMIINTKDLSKKERKQAFKQWRKAVTSYDVVSANNGEIAVDPKYDKAFYDKINLINARVIKYSESADGMMTSTQKAQITTTFLGQMLLLHRQYFPIMLVERLAPAVYDLDTQQISGGTFLEGFKGAFNLLLTVVKFLTASASNKSIRAGYLAAKEFYDSKFDNKKASTKNYMMSRYRLYQLKLISSEIVLGSVVSIIASIVYKSSKNEIDQDKKRILSLLSYMLHRTQWESLTPYRATDAFNTIKSPSAATGTIDKFQNAFESAVRTNFPSVYGSLYDTFVDESDKNSYNPTVQSGVYKGLPKEFRDAFRLTAFHNAAEQLYGSDTKDKYYVNQIMKQSE